LLSVFLFYGVSKVPTFLSVMKQKNINALQGRWFFFGQDSP
jgi:hypothetical protein